MAIIPPGVCVKDRGTSKGRGIFTVRPSGAREVIDNHPNPSNLRYEMDREPLVRT